MRINFGCGSSVLPGFFNIDAAQSAHPIDLIHAVTFDGDGLLTNPIPLNDGCADELHAYHVLEHVYAWEAKALVAEWRRLLKRGGLLVLELPDLEHACRNLLASLPDQMNMWPLYGDPAHRNPFMCHRWGYTPTTLQSLLTASGFKAVQMPPQTHGARINRDMRFEALKQ